MDAKYEALFTPWKIGNVEIKNRIVMCPMGGTSLFGWFELTGCGFDKEAAKLFLERANNNVGLIIPGIAPLRDTFWGKWLWQNPKMFEELKVLFLCKREVLSRRECFRTLIYLEMTQLFSTLSSLSLAQDRNSGNQNTWRNDCMFSSVQWLSRV